MQTQNNSHPIIDKSLAIYCFQDLVRTVCPWKDTVRTDIEHVHIFWDGIRLEAIDKQTSELELKVTGEHGIQRSTFAAETNGACSRYVI